MSSIQYNCSFCSYLPPPATILFYFYFAPISILLYFRAYFYIIIFSRLHFTCIEHLKSTGGNHRQNKNNELSGTKEGEKGTIPHRLFKRFDWFLLKMLTSGNTTPSKW